MRTLHSFEPDFSLSQATYRLFARGRVVGLAKRVGGGFFYSEDGGYAWVGKSIWADRWAIGSGIRDRHRQLIHNCDEVVLHDQGRVRRKVLVVDDRRELWLYDLRSRQLDRIEDNQFRRIGSCLVLVKGRGALSHARCEQIRIALETLHLARDFTRKELVCFTAAVGGTALVVAGVARAVAGATGFLAPLGVAFVVSWFVHRLRMLRTATRLSRVALQGLSHRVAVGSGLLLTTAFACLRWCAPSAEHFGSASSDYVVIPLFWIAATLTCGVCMLLAGDLATWQSGGYPGEGSGRIVR